MIDLDEFWGSEESGREFDADKARARPWPCTALKQEAADCSHWTEFIFEDLPGLDAPLWGADAGRLYLRRGSGVFVTEVPNWARGSSAHVRQTREGFSQTFGDIWLRAGFDGKAAWHLGEQRVSPRRLAELRECQIAEGSLVEDVVREGERAYFIAPSFLSEPPAACELRSNALHARLLDGRALRLDLSGWIDPAKAKSQVEDGAVWLRGSTGWALPWEIPVTSS